MQVDDPKTARAVFVFLTLSLFTLISGVFIHPGLAVMLAIALIPVVIALPVHIITEYYLIDKT